MSVAYRSTCRPTIRQPLLVDISTNIWVECQSTYRPMFNRHVGWHIGRHWPDMSTDISVEGCTKYIPLFLSSCKGPDFERYLKTSVNCNETVTASVSPTAMIMICSLIRGPLLVLQYTVQQVCTVLYYIKVSGIASGNKLIKTIRYPHMWRYDTMYLHAWRYRWFRFYQVCFLNCS